MIKGLIHENRPLIRVTVGSSLGVQEIVGLLDTGFTGELKLSSQTATELGLEVTHTESVALANEETILMRASLAEVVLEDVKNTVSVLIDAGLMPIIGIGLLRSFGYKKINFDFSYNILTLER